MKRFLQIYRSLAIPGWLLTFGFTGYAIAMWQAAGWAEACR